MAWNKALTELMNSVADSATETLQVQIVTVSAGSIPICATASDTIGVSAATTTAFTVSGNTGLYTYDTLSSATTSSVAASTVYRLPSYTCKSVAIKADDDNANNVYIGAANISADNLNGYRLDAGQSISLRVGNLNTVYFVADATGQKVHWIAIV